ncbi:hypothetical protein Hanom_Chr03g00185681 [Helianthus anomalus]
MDCKKKKLVPVRNKRFKREVNPQFRRLGNLERTNAHFMVIKRFRYNVLMFWVKCSFFL